MKSNSLQANLKKKMCCLDVDGNGVETGLEFDLPMAGSYRSHIIWFMSQNTFGSERDVIGDIPGQEA